MRETLSEILVKPIKASDFVRFRSIFIKRLALILSIIVGISLMIVPIFLKSVVILKDKYDLREIGIILDDKSISNDLKKEKILEIINDKGNSIYKYYAVFEMERDESFTSRKLLLFYPEEEWNPTRAIYRNPSISIGKYQINRETNNHFHIDNIFFYFFIGLTLTLLPLRNFIMVKNNL